MTNKKPLLKYQKRRLRNAIEEISNPIFSTYYTQSDDYQLIECFEKSRSAKLSHGNFFGAYDCSRTTYTIPRLFKGKKIESVPKCSTRAKEKALQNWYVDFLPITWGFR